MSSLAITITFLVVLLFSAILHEIAHGAVAEYFGDNTARLMGRITLNPISHIDPYLTILLPALLYFGGSPIVFGAAKPVPVDYSRLRNFRWGVFWVSCAGVLTNLFLAAVFSIPLRFFGLSEVVRQAFGIVIEVNVFLAVFNLLPIPPLDGSKVLAALLGEWAIEWIMKIERKGMWALLPFFAVIYLLFLSNGAFNVIVAPVINFFFHVFALS